MSHREFTDERGSRWQVWDVNPALAERRKRDRRAVPRSTPDRRTRHEKRAVLPADLRDGWLCFETVGDRRRLTPIPPRWESMSDAQLQRVLATARSVRAVLDTRRDRAG